MPPGQTLESLTVYTAEPIQPAHEGQEGGYRNIVGVDIGSRILYMASFEPGSEQTLVDVTHKQLQQETLNLPPEMIKRLREYYDGKIGLSSFNYSCHNFAAAVQGHDLTPEAAQQAANNFIGDAQPQTAQRRLNPGEQGVYGTKTDGYNSALHSVVGLNHKEVVQVDGQGGMVSIVPYETNHKFFGSGSVEFFARAETPSRFSLRAIATAVMQRLSRKRR